MAITTIARSDERWFQELPNKLQEAVDHIDYVHSKDWNEISSLSEETELDGITVYGSSTVIQDGNWIAPATMYIKLKYDLDSDQKLEFNESLPARILFRVEENDHIVITSIKADTSAIFETKSNSETEQSNNN